MDIKSKYLTGEHIFYGKVSDITDYSSDKSTYILSGKTDDKTKIKLLMYTDSLDCNIGDYMTVYSDFSEIENSYTFSAQDYYNAKNIYLQTDTVTKIIIEKNLSKWELFKNKILEYRENISSRIIQKFKAENGGILIAMIFGDKEYLDTSIKTAFYRTGIGHIMAVSGLHLVFFVSIVDFVLKKFSVSSRLRCIISVVVSFLFALCVGFGISVIRAAIMITIIKFARFFYRQGDGLNSLGICAFFMVLKNPVVVMDSSFLLSVSGTFGVSVFAPFILENIKINKLCFKPIKSFISMLCVSLCIFPVSVLYFKEISLISPLSNVVLIPVCMIILFIGFIIFLTGANEIILNLIYPIENGLINLINYITSKTATATYLRFNSDKESFILLIFCIVFAVAIIYFLFKNTKITALSVVFSIMIMSISVCVKQYGQKDILRVALLEKSGSKVIVINYQNKADIIDITGGTKSSKLAYEYLEDKMADDISSIILFRKIGFSLASYTENFKYSKVSSVLIPSEYKSCIDDRKICNREAIYFNDDIIEITYNKLNIKINTRDKTQPRVDIVYNDTTLSFMKNQQSDEDKSCDIAVFYEQSDYCNVVYNNQSKAFSAYVEFEISSSKNVKIRNLI
jgi:ComEC/Rec2-related protein